MLLEERNDDEVPYDRSNHFRKRDIIAVLQQKYLPHLRGSAAENVKFAFI